MENIYCWEFMECGEDRPCCSKGCPAHPHKGRRCWSVAGTMHNGETRGVNAKEIGDCIDCGYFLAVTVERTEC